MLASVPLRSSQPGTHIESGSSSHEVIRALTLPPSLPPPPPSPPAATVRPRPTCPGIDWAPSQSRSDRPHRAIGPESGSGVLRRYLGGKVPENEKVTGREAKGIEETLEAIVACRNNPRMNLKIRAGSWQERALGVGVSCSSVPPQGGLSTPFTRVHTFLPHIHYIPIAAGTTRIAAPSAS